MFPQALIDQWLRKSHEERRSVVEDPKATPAIRRNIDRLEAYCRTHPYAVFCASPQPPPRPFPLRALETVEEVMQERSRPPAIFTAPLSDEKSGSGPTTGVGGRYRSAAEKAVIAAAAAAHLSAVQQRVTAYLETADGVLPADKRQHAGHLAEVMIRLLSEAAVSAVYREGTAAQVEAAELALARRAQPNRKLQLRAPEGGPRVADGKERDGAADAAGEESEPLKTVRSMADYRSIAQGLVGVWGLLQLEDSEDALPMATRTCRKRNRDNIFEARSPMQNSWATLREEALRRRFGDCYDTSPSTMKEGDGVPLATRGNYNDGDSVWANVQVHVSERDVLFALQRVVLPLPRIT